MVLSVCSKATVDASFKGSVVGCGLLVCGGDVNSTSCSGVASRGDWKPLMQHYFALVIKPMEWAQVCNRP